ncbi:MAG: hypothetical protein ACXVRH_00345, partial [Thermoleophilaceae bacterium]
RERMPERQKRKRRPLPAGEAPRESRSELRNAEARAALEPLADGERPGVVTVAALVAFVLASGNLIAWLAGVKVDGSRPAFGNVVAPAAIMLGVGVGMWRARYWAVVVMEGILALLIVIVAVVALKASSITAVLVVLAVLVQAGVLFWKLVKAMARLQMPERR